MENKNQRGTASKVFDVVVESIMFIAISYALVGYYFSFKASPVYIGCFCIQTFVVCKYLADLKSAVPSKILRAIIIIASIAALVIIMYVFGYFPVGTELKKTGW
jgi:hypothetical protein